MIIGEIMFMEIRKVTLNYLYLNILFVEALFKNIFVW